MLFIPTGKRSYSIAKKKRGFAQSVVGLLQGLDPIFVPSLLNSYVVNNIVPYDSVPGTPQKQHIDNKSSTDLFRPTCVAPCDPPKLTVVNVAGTNYAQMDNGASPPIFGQQVTHLDGVKILNLATSLTCIYYIKDTVGVNAKHRYIQTVATGAAPASPNFLSALLGTVTNHYVKVQDGAKIISITDGEDYQTNGSIIAITFDATTGTLRLHNYSASYVSIDATWNPATVFYGATWAHGSFWAWDAILGENFDGLLGDLYYFNTVLANNTINSIAQWYANKFGLTLSNVWTNI